MNINKQPSVRQTNAAAERLLVSPEKRAVNAYYIPVYYVHENEQNHLHSRIKESLVKKDDKELNEILDAWISADKFDIEKHPRLVKSVMDSQTLSAYQNFMYGDKEKIVYENKYYAIALNTYKGSGDENEKPGYQLLKKYNESQIINAIEDIHQLTIDVYPWLLHYYDHIKKHQLKPFDYKSDFELLNTRIKDLERQPVGTVGALKRQGIERISDLLEYNKSELSKLPRIGHRSSDYLGKVIDRIEYLSEGRLHGGMSKTELKAINDNHYKEIEDRNNAVKAESDEWDTLQNTLSKALSEKGDVLMFKPNKSPLLPKCGRYGIGDDYLVYVMHNDDDKLECLLRSSAVNTNYQRIPLEDLKKRNMSVAKIINERIGDFDKFTICARPYDAKDYLNLLFTSPKFNIAVQEVYHGGMYNSLNIPLSTGREMHFSAIEDISLHGRHSYIYSLCTSQPEKVSEGGMVHEYNDKFNVMLDRKSEFSLSPMQVKNLMMDNIDEINNAIKNFRANKDNVHHKAAPSLGVNELSDKEREGKEYVYTMMHRPPMIGTYPKDGIVSIEENGIGFAQLHYDRQLTDKEVYDFELRPDTDLKKMVGNTYKNELCDGFLTIENYNPIEDTITFSRDPSDPEWTQPIQAYGWKGNLEMLNELGWELDKEQTMLYRKENGIDGILQHKAAPEFEKNYWEEGDITFTLGEGFKWELKGDLGYTSRKPVKVPRTKEYTREGTWRITDYINEPVLPLNMALRFDAENGVPYKLAGMEVKDGKLLISAINENTSKTEVLKPSMLTKNQMKMLKVTSLVVKQNDLSKEIDQLRSYAKDMTTFLKRGDAYEGYMQEEDASKTVKNMRKLIHQIPYEILPVTDELNSLGKYERIDISMVNKLNRMAGKAIDRYNSLNLKHLLKENTELSHVEITPDNRVLTIKKDSKKDLVKEEKLIEYYPHMYPGMKFRVRMEGGDHEIEAIRKKNENESVFVVDYNPDKLITLDREKLVAYAKNYYQHRNVSLESIIKGEVNKGNTFVNVTNPRHQENMIYSIAPNGLDYRMLSDFAFVLARQANGKTYTFTERQYNEKFVEGVQSFSNELSKKGFSYDNLKKLNEDYEKAYRKDVKEGKLENIPFHIGRIQRAYDELHHYQYTHKYTDEHKAAFTQGNPVPTLSSIPSVDYSSYKIPDDAGVKSVYVNKNNKGQWLIGAKGTFGKTESRVLTRADAYALTHSHSATKEQLAAKYFSDGFKPSEEKKQSNKSSRSLKV